MIGRSIGNVNLLRLGIKIGIADFYSHTRSEFLLLAQLKCYFFHHGNEYGFQPLDINRVFFECALGGDRFLLRIGHHGRFIDAMRFVPE